MLPFDGLWEDMNEASDFCGGVCYGSQKLDVQKKYDLKYTPTGRDLESQSLPLDGYHYGGLYEVDVHSLFGTMEVSVTHDWFKEQKKRTMIIERSSIFGMGKFGSRWLGDQ
jgi:alpha-glucosidase (family GH31 glycosyl hydrolase)